MLHAVCDFLRARGLVGASDLAGGGFRLVRRAHRNDVFRSERPPLFLKRGRDAETVRGVAREAAVYRAAASLPRLRRLMPGFVGFDGGFLILRSYPGARSLRETALEDPAAWAAASSSLGVSLAELHQVPPSLFRPTPPPSIFSLARPPSELLDRLSGGGLSLIRTLQSVPELGERLRAAGEDWSPAAFTHQDVRWDNWLDLGRRAPLLIDWEFAGLGDPAWDVGGVFAGFLDAWLAGLAPFSDAAKMPARVRRAAARFYRAYAARRRVSDDFLRRCVVMAACRLPQTALEQLQSSPAPAPSSYRQLQLSLNLLRRPDEAAERLFGLP